MNIKLLYCMKCGKPLATSEHPHIIQYKGHTKIYIIDTLYCIYCDAFLITKQNIYLRNTLTNNFKRKIDARIK